MIIGTLLMEIIVLNCFHTIIVVIENFKRERCCDKNRSEISSDFALKRFRISLSEWKQLETVIFSSKITFIIMLRNSNLLTLQNDLNSQASCQNKWCKSNKLTINPQKCHILAIFPKSNKNVTDFFVKLDGTVISAENGVEYLGINLDLNLNFRKHIEVIENTLSRPLRYIV